jgi:ankyrin repeat protein
MKMLLLLCGALLLAGCNPGLAIPPLCEAARTGDTARITQLIRDGADPDQRGGVNDWTALMHAVHKNQPAAVRALLEAGADPNATAGARGRTTALRLAEVQGLWDIAAMLRERQRAAN